MASTTLGPSSMLSLPSTHSTHSTHKPTTFLPCYSSFNPTSLSRSHQPTLGLRNPSPLQRFSIRCGVTQIDQSQFTDTVLKSQVPVLVEFIADWCGPCRLIAPAIEWASQEYKDRVKIVKIDHDANPQLIEEYKIYGLPGLIMFSNGVEVRGSRKEGAMTKVKLKEYLDAALESIAVA